MATKNKLLKLKLYPVDVTREFPAIWEGIFNRLPKKGEGRANKSRIMKIMNDDLARKIAANRATKGFKLHAKWTDIPYDPLRVFLKLTAIPPPAIKGIGGGGQDTSPTPKSPPPPPQ